jgi:hypothetical protein
MNDPPTKFRRSVINAPSNFLMDSITSPKMKTTKGERVRVHSLVRNILGVEGHDGASG